MIPSTTVSRRSFIKTGSHAYAALAVGGWLANAPRASADATPPKRSYQEKISAKEKGARLDLDKVKSFVGVSHGNFEAVKKLLAEEPTLVNCAHDWGDGDWETGLGAAAHVGNPEIALYLLERGARLDVFAAAMLGLTDVVKAAIAFRPDTRDVLGPHGIPLYSHAVAGDDRAKIVREYLESLHTRSDGLRDLPLMPAEIRQYLGRYERQDANQTKFEIRNEGVRLTLVSGQGAGNELLWQGGREFRSARSNDMKLVFNVKDKRSVGADIDEGKGAAVARRID